MRNATQILAIIIHFLFANSAYCNPHHELELPPSHPPLITAYSLDTSFLIDNCPGLWISEKETVLLLLVTEDTVLIAGSALRPTGKHSPEIWWELVETKEINDDTRIHWFFRPKLRYIGEKIHALAASGDSLHISWILTPETDISVDPWEKYPVRLFLTMNPTSTTLANDISTIYLYLVTKAGKVAESYRFVRPQEGEFDVILPPGGIEASYTIPYERMESVAKMEYESRKLTIQYNSGNNRKEVTARDSQDTSSWSFSRRSEEVSESVILRIGGYSDLAQAAAKYERITDLLTVTRYSSLFGGAIAVLIGVVENNTIVQIGGVGGIAASYLLEAVTGWREKHWLTLEEAERVVREYNGWIADDIRGRTGIDVNQ